MSKLQTQCNVWNLKNHVGTLVRVHRYDGETIITSTRSPAFVLGVAAMVWVNEITSGSCYHLDRVTPLYELQLDYL